MDNTNSKIATLSFLSFSVLIGFTIATLLKVFSGAFGPVARAMELDIVRHGVPVASAMALFIYLQFNRGVLNWADQVIAEVKKIVWPPSKDTKAMTVIVIVMVFISSLIISFFDMVSGFVLNQLVK